MPAYHNLLRRFLLLDAEGRNLDVTAKLEKLSGNKDPYFSIGANQGGRKEILAAEMPEDVRADVEALIAVDGAYPDIGHAHALENGIYHLQNGDFQAAHRTLMGAGPIDDLYLLAGRAASRHAVEFGEEVRSKTERLKGLASDMLKAKAGMEDRAGEGWMAKSRARKAATDLATALREEFRVDASDEAKLRKLATEGPGESFVREVKARHAKACLAELLGKHILETCRPVWQEATRKAMEALTRPDYRDERRPPIERDERTFTGFAATRGLALTATPIRDRTDGIDFPNGRHFSCKIASADVCIFLEFSQGHAVRQEPTIETILESLQGEYGSVHERSRDEFIDELFSPKTAAGFRMAERSYDLSVRTGASLRMLLGEDDFRFLMSEVGDNPPLAGHFDRAPTP